MSRVIHKILLIALSLCFPPRSNTQNHHYELHNDKITASQIIRFLPRELITNHYFNHELWDLFDDVHFLAQKQILDQFLHCNQLSDKLLNNFITYAKEAKESLFIQILKIILNQSNIPLNKDQALLEIVKNKKENLSGGSCHFAQKRRL